MIPGQKLEPGIIDQMWTLWRQEFILFGDESARHQHFVDTCRELTRVGLVRDRDGDLVGFWSARAEFRTWQGRRINQVYVPHYVVRQDQRGTAAPYVSAIRSFVRGAIPHPRTPTYVVAGSFPGSYIAIRSGPTELVTLEDADPWQRGLLLDVAATMGGEAWDANTGLIRGRQVPRDAMRGIHSHGRHATLFADYERLNPTWREGTVPPVLVRVRLNPLPWMKQIGRRLRSDHHHA